jgi:hypothetical protein
MENEKDLVTVDVELAVLETTVNNGTTLLSPPELTPAQESKLWRKMDLRLLPILAFIFLMAYMDRGDELFSGLCWF